jgi:hypothetical protein
MSKDYDVKAAFLRMNREATRLGAFAAHAKYMQENCLKIVSFNEKGAAGYREVLDGECYLRRESAGMKEDNNNRTNSRRIVDLKTGKTRQEEEYEKTVRLLNLMKGPKNEKTESLVFH